MVPKLARTKELFKVGKIGDKHNISIVQKKQVARIGNNSKKAIDDSMENIGRDTTVEGRQYTNWETNR